MHQSKVLVGVLAYEFKMQFHRRSLWIAFIGCTLLLSRTLLNEMNNRQLFGLNSSTGILGIPQAPWIPTATLLEGLASLLLLLGIAIFVLYILWRFLSWQQNRQ